MSTPFLYRFDLLATRELKAEELLDKPLGLELQPNDAEKTRWLHGQIRSMTSLGRGEGYDRYSVEVVPWIWFLSLHRDCRIFQEKSVKEIVEQVFADRGFSDYRFSLTGSYPKRDFTVQFGESDLDFVSRLLEENGLFYFFEHEKSKHTLVIGDHQGALAKNPVQPEILYRPDTGRALHMGVVAQISVQKSVYTGGTRLVDYFYEKPTADLHRDVKGIENGIGVSYHYPGGYEEGTEGKRLAEVRQEAEEASREKLVGAGSSAGLLTGYRFDLKESASADGDYLIVSTHIETGVIDQAFLEGEEGEVRFRCDFEAIPYATPYRPPRRTPRPHLGLQTAVVVGPKGEEIYTDNYGRVKVHFRWDREGKKDEKSSCWIRVASTWAGNKWGAFQVPRIGQEVIVEFLDGDPDRPLITGSVYNAQQMPPWSAAPTQSGWKSHSTKQGAADSNELRFEDKKGEEEIYIRAEKDLTFEVVNDETGTIGHDRTTTIENDDTKTVRNDETTTVENDRAVTVEANETMKVAKNRSRKVSKNEKVSIDGKQTIAVGGNQTVSVTKGNRKIQVKQGNLETKVDLGNVETKAALGKITYEAMQSIELKVGANSIKIDQTGITMTGVMVKIEGKAMAEVKAAMVQVNGSGMLMAKGGLTMIG